MNRIAFLLVGVVLSSQALADARDRLDRFADGLVALSAEFSQVTLDERGWPQDESSGWLYFQSPDRFRWSYQEPFPQEMVADGRQLWHFDESLEQVTVREQPPADESPLMVLTRPDLLDRFYEIEPTDEDHILRFRPLSEDGEFELASLHFIGDTPAALELVDRFGQLTRVELHRLVRNPELDEALFSFVIPEGADVLEGY